MIHIIILYYIIILLYIINIIKPFTGELYRRTPQRECFIYCTNGILININRIFLLSQLSSSLC